MSVYHTPVLLKRSVGGLSIKPGGIYLDLTFGGGGHSKEILNKLRSGKLIAFDQDADAIKNTPENDNFTFVPANFRYFPNFLNYFKIDKAHGILADLGVSSHQFDQSERGFSFRFDGPLDMRMNQSLTITAADIVNKRPEEELQNIFRLYGEIRNSRHLAKIIKNSLSEDNPVSGIADFLDRIKPAIPIKQEKKYLAQVFQALRIEVNQELEALKETLLHTVDYLEKGGRLVVITYHSLEDRLVKNFMKTGNFKGEAKKDFYGNIERPFEVLSTKAIAPTEEEIELNPRARSAKLRIAERI